MTQEKFKALLLDETGVLLEVVTLAAESELTARHVDLRPHGGDCDREPGRYRWDRENQTLVPLKHPARRGGQVPDLEAAFASLLEALEGQGFKLNDKLMVWRAAYRDSVDYLGGAAMIPMERGLIGVMLRSLLGRQAVLYAQHDQVIANADGATVRADFNAALAALFGLSSGLTAPATTIAYMLWADTTTGLLKIRNAANSGWISLGTLATAQLGGIRADGTIPFAIGSDADGDIWYRASSAIARLAKGAANTSFFMNAAATAPEWAVGKNVLTTTWDASTTGSHAVTGVGFKPSSVELLAGLSGMGQSVGFATAAGGRVLFNNGASTPGEWTPDGSFVAVLRTASGGSTQALLALATFDADGATFTKSKSGSPTGTATGYLKFHR